MSKTGDQIGNDAANCRLALFKRFYLEECEGDSGLPCILPMRFGQGQDHFTRRFALRGG